MRWRPEPMPLGETLDAVGIGEALLLLQSDLAESFNEVHSAYIGVAGAEFNVCAAIASLGGRTSFLSRIGDDLPARKIRTEMDRIGIDTSLLTIDSSRPTGIIIRETPADGSRVVDYFRRFSAASQMNLEDYHRLFGSAPPRTIVMSGLTATLGSGLPDLMLEVAKAARGQGIAILVDANLRAQLPRIDKAIACIVGLLPHVSLLSLGMDEAKLIFQTEIPEDIFNVASELGVSEIVLTDGERGCWYQTNDGIVENYPTLATTVRDPVGAGDAFFGGYIGCRLAGGSPMVSAQLGTYLASQVIRQLGDTAGLPDRVKGAQLLSQILTNSERNLEIR